MPMKYYSIIKKNKTPFAAAWMQVEIIMLSEVSQKEKDKYRKIITFVWNLKYGINEPIYKTETDSQTQKTDLWLPRRGLQGGMNWKFGVSRCKL